MESKVYPYLPLVELVNIYDSLRIPVKKADRKPGPYPYYGASGVADCIDSYIFDGVYLLLAEDGDNLKTQNTPIAFMASGKFWVNNHAHILQGNASADTRFLCYALQIADVKSYLSGSTRPKLTQGDMKRIPVYAPELSKQKQIARILGTLDDKIELNRQMNETLEAMAQAIFKSWFIDFDPVHAKAKGQKPDGISEEIASLFPDSFEESELGMIPKGWSIFSFGHLINCGIGGTWGNEKKIDKTDKQVFCLRGVDCHELAIGNMPSPPMRYIKERQITDRSISEGSILIEAMGSNCGRSLFWFSDYEKLFSPGICYGNFCKRFNPIISIEHSLLVWYKLKFFYDLGEFANLRKGTAFPNLDISSVLKNLKISTPKNSEIINLFYEMVKDHHSIKIKNIIENNTLFQLRNTLLPKLLSGEISVKEAEKEIEKKKELYE